MWRRFSKTNVHVVSFCERCGAVCDSACHIDALRERARRQVFAYGWRQA